MCNSLVVKMYSGCRVFCYEDEVCSKEQALNYNILQVGYAARVAEREHICR